MPGKCCGCSPANGSSSLGQSTIQLDASIVSADFGSSAETVVAAVWVPGNAETRLLTQETGRDNGHLGEKAGAAATGRLAAAAARCAQCRPFVPGSMGGDKHDRSRCSGQCARPAPLQAMRRSELLKRERRTTAMDATPRPEEQHSQDARTCGERQEEVQEYVSPVHGGRRQGRLAPCLVGAAMSDPGIQFMPQLSGTLCGLCKATHITTRGS